MLFPPLAMFLPSIGGLAAGFTCDAVHPERKNLVFLSCLMRPIAIASIENFRPRKCRCGP